MADFRDPLSFGAAQEDLEDLTRQLDGPLLAGGADDDPFGSLAADDKQQHMAFTYGQLVTPQPPAEQPAAATPAPAPAPASTQAPLGQPGLHDEPLSSSPSSSSTPLTGHQHQQQQQHQQAAAAGPWPGPGGSSGGSSSLPPPAVAAPDPDGGGISSIASPRLPSPAPARELPLMVTVSEPLRKEGSGVLGMKAGHIEYLVTSRSSLPGWSAPQVAVRRRFRDFVALAELLKARFRGHFVPPRPEKNAVEGQRMSEAFVEERRAGLAKYLQRLAAHPAIGPSEALRVFLETPGDLGSSVRWQGLQPPSASIMEGTAKFSLQLIGRESRVVDPVAAAQPAAASKDLMRAMKEAAQGIGMRGGREVPLEELDLRRLREAAEEMREQLGATSRAAEKLVAKLDGLGAAGGDLGLSLFKLAKFEEAEGGALASFTGTLRFSSSLITDQKRSAAALVRVSKMMAKVTGRVALELGTLHDSLAAMPAAIRGYMSREHQMLTWHTLAADLEAKQKALAEADKTKVKRVDELRGDISRLELSVGAARAEYDKIKAANLSETARFAAERRGEYGAMLEAFTATQVAACERMAEVWVQLAAELGASPEQLAAVARSSSSTGLLGTAPQPPAPQL